MKKLMVSAVSMALCFQALAGVSYDQHYIPVSPLGSEETFSLNTESTRTVYRTETVQRTCYREVFSGYRRVCNRYNFMALTERPETKPGRQNPHPEPRGPRPEPREPRPAPRPMPEPRPMPPICHDVPIYRTEAYACSEIIQVPYQVFDHQSSSLVHAKISAATEANCGFNFNLRGDDFSIDNSCTHLLGKVSQNTFGSTHDKTHNINITFLDASTFFTPLNGGLKEMHIEGNKLLVQTGNLLTSTNFSLRLYVERKRLMKKDLVLIDRALTNNEVSFLPINNQIGWTQVDLSQIIPGFESSKKHIIRLNLDLIVAPDLILNPTVTPNLHQEDTITINR